MKNRRVDSEALSSRSRVRPRRGRLTSVAAALVLAAVGGLTAAAPAQAACGQMDAYREPSNGMWLNYAYGSNYTKVEPHTSVRYMRAVIARYSSGVRQYYGPWKQNWVTSGSQYSYVSATNGTYSGNGYSVSRGFTDDELYMNPFYNDYNHCKFTH